MARDEVTVKLMGNGLCHALMRVSSSAGCNAATCTRASGGFPVTNLVMTSSRLVNISHENEERCRPTSHLGLGPAGCLFEQILRHVMSEDPATALVHRKHELCSQKVNRDNFFPVAF